jgi:hypothetical protein
MKSKKNIKTNERELSSKIAEWFNDVLKTGTYAFKEASAEPGIRYGDTTYFGDIVIWINRESKQAFSYLELKPPSAQKEDLERFRKKQ